MESNKFSKNPYTNMYFQRNLIKEILPKDKEGFGSDLREIYNPSGNWWYPRESKNRVKEKAKKSKKSIRNYQKK